jgi:hypothetical protein
MKRPSYKKWRTRFANYSKWGLIRSELVSMHTNHVRNLEFRYYCSSYELSVLEPTEHHHLFDLTGPPSYHCAINIRAYSAYDFVGSCLLPNTGFVILNSHIVWQAGWCSSYPNLRGVNTMIVNPVDCTASDQRQYDTLLIDAPAQDLTTYLSYVRKGAILVGVTGDEPTSHLSPALSLLRAAGVDVTDVQYRGSFAFVIQLGYPEKTIYAKSPNAALYTMLNLTITGEIYACIKQQNDSPNF